ncbi:MAG: hypothetical protein MHMPM18_004687 [Marteilia pararefringens]
MTSIHKIVICIFVVFILTLGVLGILYFTTSLIVALNCSSDERPKRSDKALFDPYDYRSVRKNLVNSKIFNSLINYGK